MKRRFFLALALFLSLGGALYADAGVTFYGDTTFGGVFNRPSTLSTLSSTATAVRFVAQPFFPNDDATCTIYGTQEGNDFDGFLLLYDGPFNPASPLTNLVALNDDHLTAEDGLGIGTSRVLLQDLLFTNDYTLVTTGFTNPDFGTFTNHIQCENPATRVLVGNGVFPGGAYDGRVVELFNGRFQAYVQFEDFSHVVHDAYSVPVGSSDSALFWFFQPANWEMLLKIANGCGLNGHYWVYMAATTNVGFLVTIVDTKPPGGTFTIFNPVGTQVNTSVANINALANCP